MHWRNVYSAHSPGHELSPRDWRGEAAAPAATARRVGFGFFLGGAAVGVEAGDVAAPSGFVPQAPAHGVTAPAEAFQHPGLHQRGKVAADDLLPGAHFCG